MTELSSLPCIILFSSDPVFENLEICLFQKILDARFAPKDAQRNTFVIDKEGKIKKIFWKVNPEGHSEEVLKAIQA